MRKIFCTAGYFLLALSLSSLFAAEEFTSEKQIAEKADILRDFQIQGEYLVEKTPEPGGLNIIADGGGKFRITAYSGGLPGQGWTPDKEKRTGTAVLSEDGKQLTIKIGDDTDVCQVGDGMLKKEGAGPLKKVIRKSPTLGLAPPAGAVVLFADGKKSDLITHGQVNEETKTLWAEVTTKPFEKKPYTLHVEFMLSYMPAARGQGRSNSGVYLDERYECQILDSFGLKGENNECGGIYQQAKPKLNMCFPPMQWQTYDFDFVPAMWNADKTKISNAKVTVKLNGVVIYEDLELKSHTPGRKNEAPEPLGLYLQGHGNKVQFQNIWLKYKD
ncbi:MAG: DUF1080 domain-containing protein [Planctomycetaceae bacterium]|jgi:hypothetical protein|nr:DUF1080 domain-containing protein [Planctomycetaceae bacterium]